MLKKSYIAAIVLIGLPVVVAAVWSAKVGSPFVKPRQTIVIADVPRAAFALLYIAQAKNYFREEGIEVTFETAKAAPEALSDALEGKVDLANVFETTVILKHLAGEAISVITALSSSQKNTGLVALKDRGILNPKDLKGRTIGVSKNRNGDFLLFLLLTGAGIKSSAVTLIDMLEETMAAALKEGRVDAVVTWNPYLTEARIAVGEDRSVLMHSDLYLQVALLAGQPKVIAQKKEAMKALLRGVMRAEGFLTGHRDEAVDIVAEHLPNYPKEAVRTFWDDFIMEAKLDNVTLNLLDQKAKWLSSTRTYKRPNLDVSQLIFSAYLREIHPEAVTIQGQPR